MKNQSHSSDFQRAKTKILPHLLPLLLFLFSFTCVRAQQDPTFIHYWQTETQYNPAAAGRNPQLDITAAIQTHASGYDNAGSTMYASAAMPFAVKKARVAAGVSFQNDAFGLFSHKRFSLQCALHLPLWGGRIGIGIQPDMLSESLEGSKAELNDANDPAFPQTDLTGSKFDLTAGIFYTHRHWYAGIGAQHLTAPTVHMGETNEYKIKTQYNFTAAYNIRLKSPFLSITPSTLLQYTSGTFRADITARVNYQNGKRQLYGGLNYSPTHSVAGFVGGRFHGVNLSYSYEAYTSGMGFGAGQHEITLGYQMDLNFAKKGKNLHKSVRYL